MDRVVLTHDWSLFEVAPDERTLRIAYESGGFQAPPTRAEVQETGEQVAVRLVEEVVPRLQPDGSRRLILTTLSARSCAAVALDQPLGGRRVFAYTADPRTGDVTLRPARRSDHPLGMPCRGTPRRDVTFEFPAQR